MLLSVYNISTIRSIKYPTFYIEEHCNRYYKGIEDYHRYPRHPSNKIANHQ